MLHSRNEAGRGLFDKELANMVYDGTVVTKGIVIMLYINRSTER